MHFISQRAVSKPHVSFTTDVYYLEPPQEGLQKEEVAIWEDALLDFCVVGLKQHRSIAPRMNIVIKTIGPSVKLRGSSPHSLKRSCFWARSLEP